MEDVIIEESREKGKYQARFAPSQGMNLKSLIFDGVEVIDQSTQHLFEERFAGLGAMIGPHFHRRKTESLPKNLDLALFPHVKRGAIPEGTDPFSHGVGRYAAWTSTNDARSIDATLKGGDTLNGVKLSDIEGQDFLMRYKAAWVSGGLELEMASVSQADSVMGIHFYYHVPGNKGEVISRVAGNYIVDGEVKPIPALIGYEESSGRLSFSLSQEADYTFRPFPNLLKGEIALKLDGYTLLTTYESSSSENSWQLWRSKNSSFVCIEPVSAADPRHPNLTVSSIKIRLELVR
ncbi:hypothetical protein [Estrella lausannensis]|uniref:Aldose 1-epimerase n=1 Tax=Estrella lausannensis TaxID=483423 RepID=A0A0H5DRL3_9BACT|nr:hypothetical protein [Estrella lausannensis]CRX38848.1 Conserved hypothetical protein [Estrella lausannensis]